MKANQDLTSLGISRDLETRSRSTLTVDRSRDRIIGDLSPVHAIRRPNRPWLLLGATAATAAALALPWVLMLHRGPANPEQGRGATPPLVSERPVADMPPSLPTASLPAPPVVALDPAPEVSVVPAGPATRARTGSIAVLPDPALEELAKPPVKRTSVEAFSPRSVPEPAEAPILRKRPQPGPDVSEEAPTRARPRSLRRPSQVSPVQNPPVKSLALRPAPRPTKPKSVVERPALAPSWELPDDLRPRP